MLSLRCLFFIVLRVMFIIFGLKSIIKQLLVDYLLLNKMNLIFLKDASRIGKCHGQKSRNPYSLILKYAL